VHDRVERSAIANEMAEYLNVDRDVIRQSMRRTAASPRTVPAQEISSAIPPNEKLLIACFLLSAEARDTIEHYLSGRGMLHALETRAIFQAALALASGGNAFSLETLAAQLDPRAQRILTEMSFSDVGVSPESAEQQALHCLRALEAKSISLECEALRRRIRESEQSGNLPEALRLTDELDRIRRASPGA
jgi:hypothetical protein